MKKFTLHLLSATKQEQIHDLVGFVAKDESGSFGILANAARRMTSLCFGLAFLRYESDLIEYLALSGGVLYFMENRLFIVTPSYLRSRDFNEITEILEIQLKADEEKIQQIKRTLHHLDQELFNRLTQLKRGPQP